MPYGALIFCFASYQPYGVGFLLTIQRNDENVGLVMGMVNNKGDFYHKLHNFYKDCGKE
jgi:flavin-dependent dehydrogenase